MPWLLVAVAAADAAWLNALDFGASAASRDNTAAFSKALAAAASGVAKTVYAPAGAYRFAGSLDVPAGVSLRGSYTSVPSHQMTGLADNVPPTDGTVLIPTAGRGSASGPPFVTLNGNSALAGLVVLYAEQERTALPVPYPWSVRLVGNNPSVTDVELLGAWNGLNATLAHRHYIARVQGQPVNVGVFVDSTYDIGRIEDVHFNPWYSVAHPFIEHQLTHGRAFVFGRSDWEYVLNTFAFGYALGYHFVSTATGEMNGNFVGLGADLATNASVRVDAAQPAGLLITNGEFTAFHTAAWLPRATTAWESSHVVVGEGNRGPIKLVGSSFWGNASQVALLGGSGTTTFASCEFAMWDGQAQDGRAAIRAEGTGGLVLSGNSFAQDKPQVALGARVRKAVVMGNLVRGALRVHAASDATNLQVGLNAADE